MNAAPVLESIGRTPLLRLVRLPGPASADVFVKWEGANPTGSMKDRMALSMVEGAERRGQLAPGGTVVEYTGGSTGSSLAFVCAAKGYRAALVCSDAFSEEKLRTMRALGAELEVIPSGDGKIRPELIQAMVDRARELAAQPGAFWCDQFNNEDNRSGYHALGRELAEALDGRVDAFVMSVGTGGAFSGTAEALGELGMSVHRVAVEPSTSPALSGSGPPGAHRIEGIGTGFVTAVTRTDLIDEIVPVSSEEAYEAARRLARVEGIFSGISTGANVLAALRVAERLGPGRRVVTIAVDSGLKYLQGDLYAG